MNANEKMLLGFEIRVLLVAAGCNNVERRRDNIVATLYALIELDINPSEWHINALAEWLPQTRKLWPSNNRLQDFIENIHAEAKATSKVSADLHKRCHTTDPVFVLGSKVAETKSTICESYDAVALVYTFGIGIGVGVILASIFWFLGVR